MFECRRLHAGPDHQRDEISSKKRVSISFLRGPSGGLEKVSK